MFRRERSVDLAAIVKRQRAKKRVRAMGLASLLDWADLAGSGMARALGDYRRRGDDADLSEVEEGLLGLTLVIEELRERHGT